MEELIKRPLFLNVRRKRYFDRRCVTLNKEYKIIDKLEIAYDEIAESAFGRTSQIEKDKIVVTS